MKFLFSFYFRYILFFLGVQMMFNIIFLITYRDLAEGVGISDQLLALVYGLKLDISLTSYVLGFPALMFVLYCIFKTVLLKRIIDVYTFLILFCLVLAYLTNLLVYKFWKFPIDRTIFDYLSTPGEMLASLSLIQLIFMLGLFALAIYLLFFQIYLRWLSVLLLKTWKRSWIGASLFLLIIPSLVVPLRGGFAISPVQTGSVYFHKNAFINHAAINPVWNLIYSLVEGERLTGSVSFYNNEVVENMMKDLHEEGDTCLHLLNSENPNIIVVLLESFAQPIITKLGGDGTAAPNYNELIKEGLFFNRMFAAGTMTDRSLAAVLGGYPSLPGSCIIHYESKAQKMDNLNLELKSAGYNSAFLYGGDIDFAHMRSFIIMSGFDNVFDDKDFPRTITRSNWGVPDQFLFDRLFEVTDKATQPFFHVLLTLSSHSPFDVPMEPVFPGSRDIEKYRNSIYYTDHSLGEFIRKAKTRPWWDQTLIILLADHGCRIGDIMAHEERRFNIPMLWLGGALEVSDTVISKYGSQTDIPVTLLHQMNLSNDKFKFSKDLLAKSSQSFAYYTFNDGIGFVSDDAISIYNTTAEKFYQKEGFSSYENADPALAYLQWLLNDFNNK